MNANVPPGLSQRRTIAEELGQPGARDVAQPEAGEDGIDLPIGLGPRVAHVEVRAQPVRDEALAGALERRGGPVVERQLALRGEQRRPPAGPGRELDDLAADRQLVEPAPGGVELGVPGGVVDRPALVAAAAQVPVVVLGGPGLVVGEHVGVDVGVGGSARPVAARRARASARHGHGPAPPAAPRSVSAWRSRKRRNPLSPALPTQSGQSCAQPSRSSGPRHVWAVPHHRQSNVARNGTGSRRS